MTKDEAVKQEIINKAQALFEQFGLKKTTMDEIAFSCGKAKSTIYHYFKSKEEIFQAVLTVEILNLRKEVKAKVEEVRLLKDKMSAYLLTFYSGIVKKLNLYRIIALEMDQRAFRMSEFDADFRQQEFENFMKFEKDYLTRILEDAYDSGEYRKMPKDDLGYFSEVIITSFFGVVSYMINRKDFEDKERTERVITLLNNQVYS